jgi:hypothetical protein
MNREEALGLLNAKLEDYRKILLILAFTQKRLRQ